MVHFTANSACSGGSSIALTGETVDLMGGSEHAWASEDGPINAEMSLKVKGIS